MTLHLPLCGPHRDIEVKEMGERGSSKLCLIGGVSGRDGCDQFRNSSEPWRVVV